MEGERPVPMLAGARAARFTCGTNLGYGRSMGRADTGPVHGMRPWAARPLDPATSRSSRHPLLRMAVRLRPGPLVRPCPDASLAAADRASVRASQKAVDTAVLTARLGRVEFMLRDEHRPTLLQGNFDQLGATRIDVDPGMRLIDADHRVHGVQSLCPGQLGVPDLGILQPRRSQ